MITCRRCGSEMERVFNFTETGSSNNYCCPMCGNETKPRPIPVDENGKMMIGNKRNEKTDGLEGE